jgi:hypothetical protein
MMKKLLSFLRQEKGILVRRLEDEVSIFLIPYSHDISLQGMVSHI